MGEEQKNYKQQVMIGLIGAAVGALGTFYFTKWLPKQREENARRQGQIIAEELKKYLKPE